MPLSAIEDCPCCGAAHFVKSKLLLIDAAWEEIPGADSREANFASIRVDDINPEFIKPSPQEQFVDGYYCSKCDVGFIPDKFERDGARYYYLRNRYGEK